MNLRTTLPSITAVVLAATTTAQSGSVTVFGTSCSSAKISAPSLPKIGNNFSLKYAGPNEVGLYVSRPILILGVSDKSWSGGKLPFQLPFSLTQNPSLNCQLLVSPDILLWAPLLPSNYKYVDVVTAKLPNDVRLIGATVYAQWATEFQHDRTGPPYIMRRYMTSDAAKVVIGR